MKLILVFDRIKNKILKSYREYIFYLKTGYKVNLVKNITLINTNLKIGKGVTIYPDAMFFGDGLIEIGDNVDIGKSVVIYSSKNGGGVHIGNNTMIAAQCYVIDMDHGTHVGKLISEQYNNVSPVHIGNDVWLGANCTVLKGSVIEDGAVIGAKGMVKGKIEKNSIAVGIPARHLKYRE